MNYKLVAALSVLTVAVLAGCNNAKSPGAVANDVAAAQQKAAENVTDDRNDASKDNVSATDKVDDKSKDLNNVEAKGAYDVALARAEGNHKVALEKCNAVSGDAQSKCKDMAASDYDAAKANAKVTVTAALAQDSTGKGTQSPTQQTQTPGFEPGPGPTSSSPAAGTPGSMSSQSGKSAQQHMKECIAGTRASNTDISESDARKACQEAIKAEKDNPHQEKPQKPQ
jgi:hypothetical protein